MAVGVLDLDTRRKVLKMPVDVLVKRSGVPRPTVFRILRGKIDKVRFGYVQQVAGVLGIAFGRPPVDPEDLCRQEAVKKARLLRSLTQGTMGLEAQAVSDDVLDDLEKKTVAKLLASKGRKLWGS